jgi:2-polyprenyl-6-methoxyphenol hydroxylase-like FAD-dependent oxidoreductase
MPDTEVLIVGAGSVGLMLANLLGRQGIPTIVLDRKPAVERSSRAIGISPISLEILQKINLAERLVSLGRPVPRVVFSDGSRALGQVDFADIGSAFPFVLAVPQYLTEGLLADNLATLASVRLHRLHEAVDFGQDAAGVWVSGQDLSSGTRFRYTANWLVACDGGKSLIRQGSGLAFRGAAYRDTFLMGDFEDRGDWGDSARLFMTARGSVESFPLPGGLRRYVLSTPGWVAEGSDYLRREIPRRCPGLDLSSCRLDWESAFGVQRFRAPAWHQGRVVLCGDAAHLMSPIVGQNMNTGFADAELLASVLQSSLANPGLASGSLKRYQSCRQAAAASATRRAWLMMRLGTSRGRLWSPLRAGLVRLILAGPLRSVFGGIFTMTSIRGANLDRLE